MPSLSSHLYPVILAGGTGTRLWPRSRRHRPKQLLDLISDRTMLQETYDRILPLVPPENIFVITNSEYREQVHLQLHDLPQAQLIGEPEGRGTAPAIGLVAFLLNRRDPEAVMTSLAADHVIRRPDAFRRAVAAAQKLAANRFLVTLGIRPAYPETGYGYVEAGDELGVINGLRARKVVRFTEKPDRETAEMFVGSGSYYWNSSIFTWRADVILEEFSTHLPQLYTQLQSLVPLGFENTAFERGWRSLPEETIDVGIMEKSNRVAVIELDADWNDVGSWASLLDLAPGDIHGNVVQGEHIGLETRGSLIYGSGRPITTVGLQDMIIVDTGDVILICPKERAQDIRKLVDELKSRGLDGLL